MPQITAKEAIKISNEKIQSGKYDIVILDEINYAVNLNLITLDDVLNLIKTTLQPTAAKLFMGCDYTANNAANPIPSIRAAAISIAV